MTTDTKQFIRQLTENADPVRPLARPSTRAAKWLVLSVLYIVLVLLIMPSRHDVSSSVHDNLFVIEQITAFATGVAAAIAAFVSIIPGYDRRWVMLPIPPLMIWLASLDNEIPPLTTLLGEAARAGEIAQAIDAKPEANHAAAR